MTDKPDTSAKADTCDDLLAHIDGLAEYVRPPFKASVSLGRNVLIDQQSFQLAVFDFSAGDDLDFIIALVNAYPALRAELLAARRVCEQAEREIQFLKQGRHQLNGWEFLPLKAWRAAREGTR